MAGFECQDAKNSVWNENYVKEKNYMLKVNKNLFDESHGTKRISDFFKTKQTG